MSKLASEYVANILNEWYAGCFTRSKYHDTLAFSAILNGSDVTQVLLCFKKG
ncbi:hypothetical protein [Bacillus safensis]|uniref:hypothetical protein n=1 Tax=Bacillus safensis TaxID=561879 RepID=UPI002E2272F8|nr:hypothetical protein [Bacillus safensis]